MEIGSIYSIATLETKQHSSIRLAGESAAYFSLCREALLVIVQKYRESSKKALSFVSIVSIPKRSESRKAISSSLLSVVFMINL